MGMDKIITRDQAVARQAVALNRATPLGTILPELIADGSSLDELTHSSYVGKHRHQSASHN